MEYFFILNIICIYVSSFAAYAFYRRGYPKWCVVLNIIVALINVFATVLGIYHLFA